MAIKDLRILVRVDCPSVTLRFWDGSGGPYVDANGDVWRAASLTDQALDEIEAAINGEAVSLPLVVSGGDEKTMNLAWADYQAGEIVGSRVQILVQAFDDDGQPDGAAEVMFTGKIDNLSFDDAATADGIRSTMQLTIVNRFVLRRMINGAVLSDVDQRSRAARLNPSAPLDRFCERVPSLLSKTIRWPDW